AGPGRKGSHLKPGPGRSGAISAFIEERPGFPGARRAPGGYGGRAEPPMERVGVAGASSRSAPGSPGRDERPGGMGDARSPPFNQSGTFFVGNAGLSAFQPSICCLRPSWLVIFSQAAAVRLSASSGVSLPSNASWTCWSRTSLYSTAPWMRIIGAVTCAFFRWTSSISFVRALITRGSVRCDLMYGSQTEVGPRTGPRRHFLARQVLGEPVGRLGMLRIVRDVEQIAEALERATDQFPVHDVAGNQTVLVLAGDLRLFRVLGRNGDGRIGHDRERIAAREERVGLRRGPSED